MAQLYTLTQANTVSNFFYRVCVDEVEMAPLPPEDLTFNVGINSPESVGSSMSGETPIAYIEKGGIPTLSFQVYGMNKNHILTAMNNIVKVGGTATADATPEIGSLFGSRRPRRSATVAVVAILYYTDINGVVKEADATVTTLPYNIVMPKAVLTDGGEFVFNPTTATMYELTFSGQLDVLNDRTWVMDRGIDRDGTYTPAAE